MRDRPTSPESTLRKICAHCGASFARAHRRSLKLFNRQRYCSIRCGNLSRSKTAEELFELNVIRSDGPDECWGWNGHFLDGYANMTVKGKSTRGHRYSYEMFVGPLGGKFVCHRCDNPACTNPRHLFLGTPADNSADMKAKGRAARGSKSPHSTIAEEDVIAVFQSCETAQKTADRFGVKRRVVYAIWCRQNWRWLTEGLSRSL